MIDRHVHRAGFQTSINRGDGRQRQVCTDGHMAARCYAGVLQRVGKRRALLVELPPGEAVVTAHKGRLFRQCLCGTFEVLVQQDRHQATPSMEEIMFR